MANNEQDIQSVVTEEKNSTLSFNTFDIIFKMLVGLKKLGWLLLLLACVGMALNVGRVYRSYSPVYSATATLTISSNTGSGTVYQSNSKDRAKSTFPYVLASSTMKNTVTADLGTTYMPGTVKATQMGDTNMFTLQCTAASYETAYEVLKSVINNYPQVAGYVVGAVNIIIVIPPTASSVAINPPDYKSTALIGAAAGAGLGLLIILIYVLFNATMVSSNDIEKTLNCKKLGVVQKVKQKKSSKGKKEIVSINDSHVDYRFVESIASIRNTVIRNCKESNVKTIMVSSTGQAEGKTTLSSNLAISIAKKHYKTIIVDCDLRNPTVKHQLEIKSDCKTITDVLEGKCSAGDAIIRVPHTSLYALLAKGFNENASEIISSDSMRVLLEALKKTFDYVIIDVPPVGLVSDAVAMQDMVDGLIYVVRHDYIKVKRIQDALESFSGSNIVMLGCVYNMSKGALANFRYGYNRYGYGYGSSYGNYGSDGYYGSDFDYKSIDKIMQKELDSIDEPESKKREEKQK